MAPQNNLRIWSFLLLWTVYGAMINTSEVRTYSLVQGVAESIVERRTFTLGNSKITDFNSSLDSFMFKGKLLPAKQPGVFVAAAVPYAFIRTFGISYEKFRDFVSAWTTWWTSCLLTAWFIVRFFAFTQNLGARRSQSATMTLALAFGTNLFAYTGTPHHDVMATCMLGLATIALLELHPGRRSRSILVAGALLGLVIFFSMLPALLVAACLVFSIFHLGFRGGATYGTGFLIGYLPTALYNLHYFGNPFTQANMAGNYSNTFFAPSWTLFFTRWNEYLSPMSNMSILHTMPVVLLGLIGILFLPAHLHKIRNLGFGFSLIHLGYLFNMGTEGHCQFGARYLMPILPTACIGLMVWSGNRAQKILLGVALAYSLAFNLIGAIGQTMICTNLVQSPIKSILGTPEQFLMDQRPLIPLLTVMAILMSAVWIHQFRNLRNFRSKPRGFHPPSVPTGAPTPSVFRNEDRDPA
jgi:hypothetical protein